MLVLGGSLATASQDHALIAVLNGSLISIYETPATLHSNRPQYAHSVHQIPLNSAFAAKVKTISFSPKSLLCEPRVLLASTTTVHVHSALPQAQPFHAIIASAAAPSPSLQSTSFLTPDDVLLVPELAPRNTIRNVISGLGVELRDVKSTSAISENAGRTRVHTIREQTGHVAFLTRPAVGKDIVVVLRPPNISDNDANGKWEIETEFLVSTSDALGLSFSPDGFWLAIWDTASAIANHESNHGSDIYIYTSTGKFYKSWKSSDRSGDKELSLGVKTVDWIIDGRLAIGTGDGRMILLAARTFEEQASIVHPTTLEHTPDSANIFVEQIAPETGARSYAQATLPAAPPTQATINSESSQQGITHSTISSDGALLASVCAETPTTVHVTGLNVDRMTTRTILIHHSPIKAIRWHPTKTSWLLIRTAHERSQTTDRVYVWSDNLPEPMIINAAIPESVLAATSSRTSLASTSNPVASWLIPPDGTDADAIPNILFTFANAALCLPALPAEDSSGEDTTILPPHDETPTRPQALSAHKLTQKTPIHGHGPEDAFDASFEQLRAESEMAQSVSESVASVTDGGFSPIKFDATDWTRRQILGDVNDDDTFVGKGRRM